MTVLVHNTQLGRMERFGRDPREPMPYADETMTAGEFRGRSLSNLVWTTSQAMQSWVAFRRLWSSPIYAPYIFKRIGEGGHAAQSQHYAGTAFDVGQNLTNARRALMRQLATRSGLWSYVEPAYLTPTWVHFDRRLGPPACDAGYPLQRQGCIGVYVCILQDALNLVTGSDLELDGIFGYATCEQVRAFQALNRLTADGVVGCSTWTALTNQAVGQG
ncbi:MAG: peptidoglycan-binding protein [Firmicutes bacterium]|nr:peptidoglycan-binding protein [Bacillota bacterium]